ncbi:MAG: response regulator [Deltaproteobacteria bacterium]|nr:response regulator [Deltaproteobacteria bacterium]MBW1870894.1 response regulator [Deltaproteobacteria bacterium]
MSRILCIEDDTETRILLKKALESAGMQVDSVWSGDKGVEAAMQGSFDCVLLDLMMPGMDGFQVIRALRTQGLTRHLPVIIVTARDDVESRQRAMAAGANEYVIKPFDLEELVQTITSLVSKSSSDQES